MVSGSWLSKSRNTRLAPIKPAAPVTRMDCFIYGSAFYDFEYNLSIISRIYSTG